MRDRETNTSRETEAERYRFTLYQEDGLALIIVLGIIAILSIIVLEFSISTHIDTNISLNFHDRTQAEYNARAGLHYAIKLLRDDNNNIDSLREPWAEPQEIFIGDLVKHYEYEKEKEEEDSFYEEEEPEPEDHGLGQAYIRITDEERRLNINKIMSNTLTANEDVKEIFVRLLGILDYSAYNLSPDDLADSIIDWIDANDDGFAETTHYEYLQPPNEPYEPSNKALQSVYELLLIKDMSPIILFGNTPLPLQESGKEDEEDEDYYYDDDDSLDYAEDYVEENPNAVYGLENFITVYTQGNVNINTTTREVLRAILDDNTSIVDEIIEKRIEEPFVNFRDIQEILVTISKEYNSAKLRYFTTRSYYYRIESIGEYRSARVRITAVVRRYGGQKVKILYQRIENMSTSDEISFIGENAKYRRR